MQELSSLSENESESKTVSTSQTSTINKRCSRCNREYKNEPTCPSCTVTGVDLEALLLPEELHLIRTFNTDTPVSLIDMTHGTSFCINASICKIGRDESNDLVVEGDRSMSRFHFQIRSVGNDYFVEDCGSRNGTFLNSSPITSSRKLQDGDIISVGSSRYKFSILQPAAQTNSTTEADNHTKQEDLDPSKTTKNKPRLVNTSYSISPEALRATHRVFDTTAREIATALDKMRSATDVDITDWQEQSTDEQAKQASCKASPQKLPVTSASSPTWTNDFIFPELDRLYKEKDRLNSLMDEIKQDIKKLDRKINTTLSISNQLLRANGNELYQVVKQVFDTLDWYTEDSIGTADEFRLKNTSKIEAVVKIVCSDNDPSTEDIEALVNQQASVWCETNYEPKGIIIVQIRPDLHPKQRPPLSSTFIENMKRKKICVLHCTQLLTIHRQITVGKSDKNYIREMLLNTNGTLNGFALNSKE